MRFFRGGATAASGLLVSLLAAATLYAQTAPERAALHSGKDLYEAGCVACHGPAGQGLPQSTIGFEPPDSFPDFTRCDQTTSESDETWAVMIREGGPARGFSSIMPAFGGVLTRQQIAALVTYLRGFCREPEWPRGELNFPRSLVTEKAFPEDEDVLTAGFNTGRPAGVDGELGIERRLGARNQLEVAVPFGRAYAGSGRLESGIGDVAVGVKRVLSAKLSPDDASGSILSVQGEVILPTGRKLEGLGTGEAALGAFASYGRLFAAQTFVQLQGGAEVPRHTGEVPANIYLRAAMGRSFRSDSVGHMWTPMVELSGSRDLESGAKTDWDVVPQVQVTLSRRRHVRADLGWLVPVTDTAGRSREVMLYVLWDTADGGLLEGW